MSIASGKTTLRAVSSLAAAVPRFARLVKSQSWSAARLESYRRAKLDETLRAAAGIPFYRKRYGRDPSPADLANLPILQRRDIAELNRSVRTLRGADQSYLCARSSGSTGQRVEFLFDPPHQHGRFAARARYLYENGWRPWTRSAWLIDILPGSPDGNLTHSRLMPGVEFFSHLQDFEIQVEWLRKTAPHFLYSMPSNLEALLTVFARDDRRLPSLRRIFTGGEVLPDAVREQARRLLGVEIADNYGSTEAFPAWQCPSGSYHVNAEHVMVEIVDEHGKAVACGNMGKVLITTLENRLMPLIRYDLGDFAIAAEGACACGRTLPVIGKILGREINLFQLPGGRLLSPWHLVDPLKALPQVRQVQMVQQALDRFLVRFASDYPLAREVEDTIRAGFLDIVGHSASLTFERVAEIPRSASGKYMAAVSALTAPHLL